MAFTFTAGTFDPVNGILTYGATTDASSAAGSITPGFVPRKIVVTDTTTPNKYEWNDRMASPFMVKTAAAGTLTSTATNAITVTGPASSPATAPTVTLGTAVHTNSCTYVIELYR